MSKKATTKRQIEEQDDDRDERDEDDEPVAAKPSRRGRVSSARDDDHDDHDHDHEHDGHGDDDEDGAWWAPHAVLGGLVLIGVFGFFGVFNSIAAKFISPLPQQQVAAAETAPPATPPPNPHQGATPPPNPHGAMAPGAQPPGETYGAKHLLVMYKTSMRAPPNVTRTKEEAQARATEAMKKAKAPGAKFEDLVKEYSDEPGAGARGGDLGTFRKGSMVPQFQEAVEKLKVNQVSDVVETPFGFHVILRTK